MGDDVLHRAIAELIRTPLLLPYGLPSWKLDILERVFRGGRLYQAVVLGGGTLINDPYHLRQLQHALRRYQPLAVFGSGVRDPDYWRDHLMQRGWDAVHCLERFAEVLRQCVFLGVRGPRSAELLAECGLEPEVIGDPALSLCTTRAAPHARTGVLGINLGCHDHSWGDQSGITAAVVEVAESWARKGGAVDLLPMCELDLGPLEEVAVRLGAPPGWRTLGDGRATLARIARCDVMICQRLHAAVFSVGSGVPVISLEYRPKCRDFMQTIARERYCVRTDSVSAGRLLELLAEVDADYAEHCEHLRHEAARWRETQRGAAARLRIAIQ